MIGPWKWTDLAVGQYGEHLCRKSCSTEELLESMELDRALLFLQSPFTLSITTVTNELPLCCDDFVCIPQR
jgi:hypothetical protein